VEAVERSLLVDGLDGPKAADEVHVAAGSTGAKLLDQPIRAADRGDDACWCPGWQGTRG
jgi:hypothetical protein